MRRWLAAEHSNRDDAAEGALVEVFKVLVDPRAPKGFAEAVMRRIDMRPVPAALSATVRWMVAVAMVATALSVAVLPLVLASLSRLVELGALVELTGAMLVGASRALASWLAFWLSLADVSRMVLSVICNLIVLPALISMRHARAEAA